MKPLRKFDNNASFEAYRKGNVEYPLVASVNTKSYVLTQPAIYYTTTDGNQLSDANTGLQDYIISHTKKINGSFKIVLKDTMNSIPNDCFRACTTLKTVRFEGLNNVTSIGTYFLGYCSSLQNIDFSGLSNVTSIGLSFLYNCTSLQSIDLSPLSEITSIGGYFLRGCDSLQSVDLSGLSKVTSIGDYFLIICSVLKTVTMPNTTGITSIGANYFNSCYQLTTIYCPKGTLTKYKTLMPNRSTIMVELS